MSRVGPIDYGVAASTLRGQTECGDVCLVREVDDGALVVAMDGLGHGADAAAAARQAAGLIERHANESLISLATRCHDRLKQTRGVVMGLANFDRRERSVSWLGVGNIEGRLLRGGQSAGLRTANLVQRPGVIGGRLPPLVTETIPLGTGDVLIFATDGVHPDFTEHVDMNDSPQHIAEQILARCGKESDDALVVVARYEE